MPALNNIEYILIVLRFMVEICSMIYFADFISSEDKMSITQRLLVMAISVAVIVPIDYYTTFPLLPILILVTPAVAISLISHRKIGDTLGGLMFGIAATYIPEIIIVAVAVVTGIKPESDILLFSMVLVPALFLGVGIVIENSKRFAGIRTLINSSREIIIVVSVSASILIVVAGRRLLWDSMMFWEGYEGTATLVTVYFIIGIYLIKVFFDFQRNKSEREISDEYNQYLNTLIEELYRRDHEYKNQLNAIIGIAESGKDDSCNDIIAFADEIIRRNAKRKSGSGVISDNSILAAYILHMKREAEDREISFDFHIAKPLPVYRVTSSELIELVANLLNNAFEAVCRFDVEYRNVSLCIEDHSIEVINYVGEEFDGEFLGKIYGIGFSTKGRSRGYGMANVMSICEEYSIRMDSRLKGAYLEIKLEM